MLFCFGSLPPGDACDDADRGGGAGADDGDAGAGADADDGIGGGVGVVVGGGDDDICKKLMVR